MPEWYRNKEWSAGTREAFFAKLAQARSQRDQYIVLQALELTDTEPKITLELVDLYFETRTDDFDDVRARLAEARALVALGQLEEAADAFRKTIATEKNSAGLSVAAQPQYAAFLVTHAVTSRYDEVDTHLGPEPDLFLSPREGFEYHVCRAVVAKHKRETDRAEYHRAAAEAEAARTCSGLSRLPKFGLMDDLETPMRRVLNNTFPHGASE